MRFLKRLLGRKAEQPVPEADVSAPACPHVVLIPRWDSADDMGDSDRVSSYLCESCKATFSREEADRLRAEEVERVRLLNVERLSKQ